MAGVFASSGAITSRPRRIAAWFSSWMLLRPIERISASWVRTAVSRSSVISRASANASRTSVAGRDG